MEDNHNCKLEMYSLSILNSSFHGNPLDCFKTMQLLQEEDLPHLLFHLVNDLNKIMDEVASEEVDLKLHEFFKKQSTRIETNSEYV